MKVRKRNGVKITTVIRKLNTVARDLVDYTQLEGKTKK
jgi:hypothetical protein